mmetsp:Transcript_110822/g.192122  ORF Transcript_110822/g.192122 Transcript_110822/m.192122 type:complete len:86 (-) Transcript_110822:210-467(-)
MGLAYGASKQAASSEQALSPTGHERWAQPSEAPSKFPLETQGGTLCTVCTVCVHATQGQMLPGSLETGSPTSGPEWGFQANPFNS